MKRGDYITYVAQATGKTVFARILRVHHDGSLTYQALYTLENKDRFLGYTYRQYPATFKPRLRFHAVREGPSPPVRPRPRPRQQFRRLG